MAPRSAGNRRQLSVVRAGTMVLLLAVPTPGAAASPATNIDHGLPTPVVTDQDLSPEQLFSSGALCVQSDSEKGWRACRGRAQDAISYQDFFRAADRHDLAEADERRWWRRQLLLSAGTVTLLMGVATLAPRLVGKPLMPVWISAGFVGGGIGMLVWGAQVSQDPLVGPAEAADIARSYNNKLREQLSLPPFDGRRIALALGYQRVF